MPPSSTGSRRVRSRPTSLRAPALLVALAAAAACGGQRDAGQDREALATGARQREAPRVRVTAVEQREMLQVLETTTVLESEAEVSLVPRTPGIVTEVLAEEGDRVAAGEVLARVDAREAELSVRDAEVALDESKNRALTAALAVQEAQAAIDNAKLAADQADRDHVRNQRLFGGDEKPSALSAQALETSRLDLERAKHEVVQKELALERTKFEERDARTAVSRAEVSLQRAQLALEFTEIRAPFRGVVASRTIRPGDSVGSAPVYVLTDTENLRAVLYRPQRELGLFAGGPANGDGHGELLVTARAEALPGFLFRGRVERTSPTIDADSGSFRVTARLTTTPEGGAGPRLLPGMLVRLQIVTDRHPDALVVPKRAVRREADQSFVLVAADGVARRVDVREDFAGDDDVEVVPLEAGTLAAGDRVVSVGARDLVDGSPVRVEGEPGSDELAAEGASPEDAPEDAPEATEDL